MPQLVMAQISTDGTMGASNDIAGTGPGTYDIAVGLGTASGVNLFHSFREFNVLSGQTVNLLKKTGIENIVSRVTGGNISKFQGQLNSQASLWLINPAGIIISDQAKFDVAGSLHLSTGDSINIGSNSFGLGTETTQLPGLSLNPVSFGFLDSNSSNLVIGSQRNASTIYIHAQSNEGLENIELSSAADILITRSEFDVNSSEFYLNSQQNILLMGTVKLPVDGAGNSVSGDDSGIGTVIDYSSSWNSAEPNSFRIIGGTKRGRNLFHSFSFINTSESRRMGFDLSPDVGNIISRVTGGDRSLLGIVQDDSSFSYPSNFWFMNPYGISITVRPVGEYLNSFSTADGILFEDGSIFSAYLDGANQLSDTDVVDYRNSGMLSNSLDLSLLSQSISLGGPMYFHSAGDLNMSASADGLVGAGSNWKFKAEKILYYSGGLQMASEAKTLESRPVISLIGREEIHIGYKDGTKAPSTISVSSGGLSGIFGGEDAIGALLKLESPDILIDNGELLSDVDSSGENALPGDIEINSVDNPYGTLVLRNGSILSVSNLSELNSTPAGNVKIGVHNFEMDASSISATTGQKGAGGTVELHVTELAQIYKGSKIDASTASSSKAADVVMTGGNYIIGGKLDKNGDMVSSGASISMSTSSVGPAGKFSLTGDNVIITDSDITAQTTAEGPGGDLKISANTLTIADTNLTSNSQDGSTGESKLGDSGSIDISIFGANESRVENSVFSVSYNGSYPQSGIAGDISIVSSAAESKLVLDRTHLLASHVTFNDTQAMGGIHVEAGDITIMQSLISSDSIESDGSSADVRIQANNNLLFVDSDISSQTTHQGKGADVFMDANNIVLVNADLSVDSDEDGQPGSISMVGKKNLTIDSVRDYIWKDTHAERNISLRNMTTSFIVDSGFSFNFSDAGSVDLKALNGNMIISGLDAINGEPERLVSIAARTSGSGNGGMVALSAPKGLLDVNRSEVSVSTRGMGDAGIIELKGDSVKISNSSFRSSTLAKDRHLSTAGKFLEPAGNANEIYVEAGSIVMDGSIMESTNIIGDEISNDTGTGSGNAGSVTFTLTGAAETSFFNDATIRVDAGDGPGVGGSIVIYGVPGHSMIINDSSISATSKSTTLDPAIKSGVTIEAGALDIQIGSKILATVENKAMGGAVSLKTSTGDLSVSDSSVNASTSGEQAAGKVSIFGKLVALLNSTISSSTTSKGRAQSVKVNANTLTMDGAQLVSTNVEEGLVAQGDAGSVTVTLASTGTQSKITNDSSVTVDAGAGKGKGGTISITDNEKGSLLVDNSIISATNKSTATSNKVEDQSGVAIDTGALTVQNHSEILAEVDNEATGGELILKANSGNLLINDSAVSASTAGKKTAGEVSLIGKLVALVNSKITSSTSGTGSAGSTEVEAGTLTMDTGARLASTNVEEDGSVASGDAGDVTVTLASTGEQSWIKQGSEIRVDAGEGAGKGGTISITDNEKGSLLVDNSIISATNKSTATSNKVEDQSGVAIDTGALTVQNYSEILAEVDNEATGGELILKANSGNLLINDSAVSASTAGKKTAGEVSLIGKLVALVNSKITSSTSGTGSAGSTEVEAGTLTMDAGARLASTNVGEDGSVASGDAGDVTVTLTSTGEQSWIKNRSEVRVDAGAGKGKGGTVSIKDNAQGSLLVDNSTISATNKSTTLDIERKSGVVIETGNLIIRGESIVSGAVANSALGGDITLTAKSGDVVLQGSSNNARASVTANTSGSGNAGSITINGKSVLMEYATVSSASTGSNKPVNSIAAANAAIAPASAGIGNAGSININYTDDLILSDSTVSTSAAESSGGNININRSGGPGAGSLFRVNRDSELTARALNNGGNITIAGMQYVLLEDGSLLNASAGGNGGDITITPLLGGATFIDNDVRIDASGRNSSGSISISDNPLDIKSLISQLDVPNLDVAKLLAQACAGQAGSRHSSLVIEHNRLGWAPGGYEAAYVTPQAMQQNRQAAGMADYELLAATMDDLRSDCARIAL